MNEALTEGGPVDTSAVTQKRSKAPKAGRRPKRDKRITVDIDKFPEPPQESPKRDYWIGTTHNCPYQNVTVAGTTFPKFSGNVTFTADGLPGSRPEPGAKVPLSDEQVDRIKAGVADGVFRFMGRPRKGSNGEEQQGRALKLTRKGNHEKAYVPNSMSDEPIGRFLYMYDVTEGFPPCYHSGEPDPLVD